MITLAVLNYVINIFDYLLSTLFNPFYIFISNLGTQIQALQVPATLYAILSLTIYFLPMGTIGVLFTITLSLLAIMIIYSFVYSVLDIIKHVPFL